MDTKVETNIVPTILSIVVAIIVFSAILVPIVDDMADGETTTLTNDVSAGMTFRLDGNDDYNLTTTDSVRAWMINGTTVDMYNAGGPLVITDKCRFEKSGGYVALYDATGSRIANLSAVANKVVVEYTAETKVFTITTYTGTGDSAELANTYTYNVENILYYIPGGDYGAIQTNGNPDITYYVNDLSQVIAGGAYITGDLDTSYFAEGTTVYVGNASYTASATATTVEESPYDNVIKGSSYKVTVTDGTNSEEFTPYTVFVPIQIQAHIPVDGMMQTLYNVIPIFVVLAILMGIVGLMYFNRNGQ